MTESIIPGIFELVQAAVQSLTAENDFQLDTIEYESYYSGVRAILCSPEIDISFFLMLKAPHGVNCNFKVKPVNKDFGAYSLFPAFNIDIPVRNDDTVIGIDYPLIKMTYPRYQKINEVLLEKTNFIPELTQLCLGIKNNLPRILTLLRPENVDETFRLNVIEITQQIKKRQDLRKNPGHTW